MSLDKWVQVAEKPKKKADRRELSRRIRGDWTFPPKVWRAERLMAILGEYENVRVIWERPPKVPDEFAVVLEISRPPWDNATITVTLLAIGTRDKEAAERLVNEDNEPEGLPDEPHIPDVDEAAYFNYFSF